MKDPLGTIESALNALGLALVDHDLTWTAEQRRLYEQAIRAVEMLRKANKDAAA